MSGTGGNDPCPCGSGRKYKKCCLVANAAVAPAAFTAADRDRALARLMDFAFRADLEGERDVASRAF